ncbi:MAG: sugar phosphate isomerase/epimerase [Phycisphaerae bacterium]|nr:sugar phosphate isomerase/epimerase [Phycisphaerae bacterium]
MNKKLALVLISFVMMFAGLGMSSQAAAKGKAGPWRLAVQAWSFKMFTFYEAIDKTASLGLGYIEAYPDQKISNDNPGSVYDPNMSAEVKQQIKDKLKASGVKLVNCGVWMKLPGDEAGCRKIFEFAKQMGIETIDAEPAEDAFDMLDKLCQEYKINLAIHNHAPPTHYWDPNTVLKVCEGRSKYIGACADTGHWMRSGINPVEALKKLEGRIISLHLKDMNEFGSLDAHCVPWGTGKADIKAILAELARQNFKGTFSIEYEYNWENSIPDISQCVEYFKKTEAEVKAK